MPDKSWGKVTVSEVDENRDDKTYEWLRMADIVSLMIIEFNYAIFPLIRSI